MLLRNLQVLFHRLALLVEFLQVGLFAHLEPGVPLVDNRIMFKCPACDGYTAGDPKAFAVECLHCREKGFDNVMALPEEKR